MEPVEPRVEEKAVDPIQKAAVAGKEVPRVLHPTVPLQHGLHQVPKLGGQGKEEAEKPKFQ